MTASDESPSPRAASIAGLAARMERIENRQDEQGKKQDEQARKQDEQAKQITALSHSVDRIEQTVTHTGEMNTLHFETLKSGITTVSTDLKDFVTRVTAIMNGEVQLPSMRQGEELVADYRRWREQVDKDREDQAVLNGQIKLLGRLAVVLATGNILGIVIAIGAIVRAANP